MNRSYAACAAAVASNAVLVGLLTLTPVGGDPAGTAFLIQLTSDRVVADAVVNILLFLPLGAALAVCHRSVRGPLITGAAFSLLIELAQLVIPGRYTNPFDVVCNAAGAAAGAALMLHARAWLYPAPRQRRVLAAAAVAVVGVLLFGSGVLFAPALSARSARIEWTPALVHSPAYPGRVLDARSGAHALTPGTRYRAQPLHGFARGTDTIRIALLAGGRTTARAPILRITDERGRDLLVISAAWSNLYFRYRLRAGAVYLDQPDVRAHGALRATTAGEPVEVRAWRTRGHDCLLVNAERFCYARSLADGWALWVHPAPFQTAPILSVLWPAVLMLPVGYYLRAGWTASAAVAATVALLLLAPRLLPVAPPQPVVIALAVAGFLAGRLLARAAARRAPAPLPERW